MRAGPTCPGRPELRKRRRYARGACGKEGATLLSVVIAGLTRYFGCLHWVIRLFQWGRWHAPGEPQTPVAEVEDVQMQAKPKSTSLSRAASDPSV